MLGKIIRGSAALVVLEGRAMTRHFLICFLGMVGILGCGSGDDPTGRWRGYQLGQFDYAQSFSGYAYEFFEDGQCMLEEDNSRYACEWARLSDGRVKIQTQVLGTSSIYFLTVDGDSAILDMSTKAQGRLIRAGSRMEERIEREVRGSELRNEGHALVDEEEWAAAAQKLREASDLENPGAMYVLGQLHMQGKGVEKDMDQAKRLLEEASDLGLYDAHVILGQIYAEKGDFKKQLKEFEAGSRLGSLAAKKVLRT